MAIKFIVALELYSETIDVYH